MAYQGERIVLHRHGKDVAAIVPLKDLELIERMEDLLDTREALRRLSDPAEKPIPYEKVKKELGL